MMRIDQKRQWVLQPGGLLFVLLFMLMLSFPAKALTEEETAAASGRGWHSLPGGRYTYITDRMAPAAGFLKIKKYWYHFDQEGYLSIGWFATEDGRRYFAMPGGRIGVKKGSLRSGYVKVNGAFYMFAEKGGAGQFGALKTGWVTAKKNTFYYGTDGEKLLGLQEIDGRLYYFSEIGAPKKIGKLVTGWKKLDGKKYYFRTSGKVGKLYGAAFRNTTVKIKGKKYTFGEDGSVSDEQVITTEAQNRFIEKIGALAHADMINTGVLASVTIAQAIVESAWGTSTLATQAKNLFGMKGAIGGTSWKSNWDGAVYRKQTQEYINGRYITITDSFRKYKSIAESVADHSAYLLGAKLGNGSLRYAGLKGCRDYTKAATIIKKGGYATAPNYVSALVNVIEKYNLDRFDSM